MKHRDRKLLRKYRKFLEDRGIIYHTASMEGTYILKTDFYTTAWHHTLLSAYCEIVNHIKRFGTYSEKGE